MSHRNLPRGLRRRTLGDGTFRYFLRTSRGSREITLDGDLDAALAQWRDHRVTEHLQHNYIIRITDLLALFEACEIPLQEPARQSHLARQTGSLITFFRESGDPEFTGLIPTVKSYLQWRGPSRLYRAGGEVRLLVRVFSWAMAHTTVQVGDCPWTSGPVVEALKVPVLKELGYAMAFYGRQPRLDVPCNAALQQAAISDAQPPLCPVADVVTIRDVLTLIELRDHSIRQLKLDGRPDHAAALSKLTEDEVRTALALSESATETGSAPRLVLGTQRAARLAAFRLTDGGRPEPENSKSDRL